MLGLIYVINVFPLYLKDLDLLILQHWSVRYQKFDMSWLTFVQFRTLVQESCFTDQNIAEVPPASREYHTLKDAVQDVRFSATSTCKLTVPLIHGTIQVPVWFIDRLAVLIWSWQYKFLSSSAAMARHIIIIGSSALHNEYSTSNWYHLARSLAVVSFSSFEYDMPHLADHHDRAKYTVTFYCTLMQPVQQNPWTWCSMKR